MKLTLFLFHLETCESYLFSFAGIGILLFGYIKTGWWGFLALVVASVIFLAQLTLHYYFFLMAYEVPAPFKILATVAYFSGSVVSLIGSIGIVRSAIHATRNI